MQERHHQIIKKKMRKREDDSLDRAWRKPRKFEGTSKNSVLQTGNLKGLPKIMCSKRGHLMECIAERTLKTK